MYFPWRESSDVIRSSFWMTVLRLSSHLFQTSPSDVRIWTFTITFLYEVRMTIVFPFYLTCLSPLCLHWFITLIHRPSLIIHILIVLSAFGTLTLFSYHLKAFFLYLISSLPCCFHFLCSCCKCSNRSIKSNFRLNIDFLGCLHSTLLFTYHYLNPLIYHLFIIYLSLILFWIII